VEADRSIDQNMAYLNCPYCPAQAFPDPRTEVILLMGFGLTKYRCISKHEFYVEEEREQEIVREK
jgi:hypothetical protein